MPSGLCLNDTNGKYSRVRLRTSSRTMGEDGLKPKANHNLTLTLSLTLSLNPKKGT